MAEKNLKIALATGGTGGHIFPAEAVAQALVKQGHKVFVVTDKRFANYSTTFQKIEIHKINSSSFAGGIGDKLKAATANLQGYMEAKDILLREKPDVVIGFGGYPSFPTMWAAIRMGLPTIIHEQNSVLGKVNRIVAPFVSVILTSFKNTAKIKTKDKAKVTYVGNPVRDALISIRKMPYPELKEKEHLHILVIGGSQGAGVFSDVVPKAVQILPEEIQKKIRIDQQCRKEDIANVEKIYNSLNINADLSPFFDDVTTRLAGAHLVISRAGASSISELLVAGRPAILVPYPQASDDHQLLNAKSAEEAGAAEVVTQNNFTPEWMANKIKSYMEVPQTLVSMAEKARAIGKKDSTERIIEIIELLTKTDDK